MIRLLAALLLTGCVSARPASAPIPNDRTSSAGRVILVSYDGLSADDTAGLLQRGFFSHGGLVRMIREGTFAERVIPVTPTNTAPTHISMITGAPPEKTGILSNTYHRRSDPLTLGVKGFEQEIEVETLWEAAHRQGRKVGILTFPGGDATNKKRKGDWGLVFSTSVVSSRIIHLRRQDYISTPTRTTQRSFSKPMGARLEWSLPSAIDAENPSVELIAIDTTDDSVENYDQAEITVNGIPVPMQSNRWFAVQTTSREATSSALYGSWSKVLAVGPSLADTVVYMGAISRTIGYPESYRQMIDREVGFWPGPPDEPSAAKWLQKKEGIDPLTFSEQADRFSRFFTDSLNVSMKQMPWDLILVYQPTIDQVEHQFRFTNERQLFFTPENEALSRQVREDAYRTFDQSLAKTIASMDPATTALVVTGDHGLAAADTLVSLNRLLIEWNFATKEGNHLSRSTRWAAFTHGHVANIYRAASVSDDEMERLIAQLRAARAPDGDVIFERVERKPAGAHRNSGDIVAFTFPRFSLSWVYSEKTFTSTLYGGQHGGLSHHPEFHTVLAAWGRGVENRRLAVMDQLSITRYVCGLLGIEAPATAQ